MKKISYKRALMIIGILVGMGICVIAGLVVLVDPFFQYHKPLPFLNYAIDNQQSQNAGMIKNFEYDSVILGSSMTINFDTEVFHEELDLDTIKLSVNAAFPKDIHQMLSLLLECDRNLDTVFLGIDPHNYSAEPEVIAYPYPEHLYDHNVLNDSAYLFNKDVILDYIIKPQIQGNNTKRNEIYWNWPYMYYGKEVIAESYREPEITGNSVSKDAYIENTEYNLEHYILPYIETMPDTQFVVFYPPYSILYWYNHMAAGDIEELIYQTEYITERLLQYPNVKVFQFQDDYDYITNYDNYSDYTHYRHEMNDYMTVCFANGENEITLENYKSVLNDMKKWLLAFDYENCW